MTWDDRKSNPRPLDATAITWIINPSGQRDKAQRYLCERTHMNLDNFLCGDSVCIARRQELKTILYTDGAATMFSCKLTSNLSDMFPGVAASKYIISSCGVRRNSVTVISTVNTNANINNNTYIITNKILTIIIESNFLCVSGTIRLYTELPTCQWRHWCQVQSSAVAAVPSTSGHQWCRRWRI